MNKLLLITLVLITALAVTACAKPVSEVTSQEYIGETVTVKGTVIESVKVGSLSGYTLMDNNGDRIFVATTDLEPEGSTTKARGVVQEAPLGLGYYLDVEN